MKSLTRSLFFAGLLAGMASAAQVQGVLMDKMCSAKAIQGGQQAAHDHTRECALMPPCQASGYGVFTADNKYLTFDKSGNAKALAALKASTKKSDMLVTVNGEISGDTIKVSSLKLQ